MENSINKLFDNYNGNSDKVKESLKLGACWGKDNPQKGILVVGINPSFDEKCKGESFGFTLKESDKKIKYFKRIQDMLGEYHIKETTAYLDLFPVKCSKQSDFTRLINEDLPFFAQLLAITQAEIERLEPKLIIVNNRQAEVFWGKHKNCVWMGYEFEEYRKELNAYRIIGFKDDPNNERVYNTVNKTNLIGSVIVFYGLYDERHKAKYPEKILTQKVIEDLWYEANKF